MNMPQDVWTDGTLTIDRGAVQVYVDEQPVELTKREYQYLELLTENAGRVVTFSLAEEKIWNEHGCNASHLSKEMAKRLRQKLGAAAEHIKTVRGYGYSYRLRRLFTQGSTA